MNRIYVQTAVLTKVKDAQFQKPHCILWCFDDWQSISKEELNSLLAEEPAYNSAVMPLN